MSESNVPYPRWWIWSATRLAMTAGFAPIAERCRTQLKESSFASLPGFLRPGRRRSDDGRSAGCDTARLPARTIVQRVR